MAKTSQFKLNLKARPTRNVFDRSYRINATSTLGQLRPFFVKDVIAGTKMQLGFENVTRMTGLKAPSFARIREHMDYFFVPYTQIWRQYEQFRTQQSHYNSAALSGFVNEKIPHEVPNFKVSELYISLGVNVLVPDSCGYVSFHNRELLMHYLGYGSFFYDQSQQEDSELLPTQNQYIAQVQRIYGTSLDAGIVPDKKVNIFRLCAYQKIYADYYRNEKYEKNNIHAYNLDNATYDSNGVFQNVPELDINNVTLMRYRWRKKDYFMSVTPELLPVDGFIGFEGFAQMTINLYSAGGAATPTIWKNTYAYPTGSNYDPNGNSTIPANLGSTNMPDNSHNPDSQPTAKDLDVNSIKLMFAREKLMKRMYMAKNNYSSQMLALFGFAPSTLRTDSVYHIGGCCNRLIVDDCPIYDGSELQHETNAVGRFAGKVMQYSKNNKCAEFEAKEDGIVMGIYSTSLENDYAALGYDRDVMRYVMEDWPFQEYQDLGRQVLLRSEFGNFPFSSVSDDHKEGVIGFVERYLEYKTSYDKVFYPFIDTPNKDGYEDFKRFATPLNTWQRSGSASQNPMIVHPENLYIQTMLVAPWQITNMTGVEYDGTPQTDCFIINGYNHFKAITPLKEKEF